MSHLPTVSVIMASYNYAPFLPAALDSVRAQTFVDWEAIVADDGSTDATADVLAPYLNDSRIRCVRTPHVGAAAARNAAIDAARGRYLAILDADDCWLPRKLEMQLPLFNREAVGVVCSRWSRIDEDGRSLPPPPIALRRGRVLAELYRDNFVCFSSAVMRRDIVAAVGGLNPRWELSEDYALLLRLADRSEFDYVDEPLVIYRERDRTARAEKNYRIVLEIMDDFRRNRGVDIGNVLPRNVVRRAYGDTYIHLGQTQSARSRAAAALSCCRGLSRRLCSGEGWKLLVSLALPSPVQRIVKRALSMFVWKTNS
jgi:glycosyltransferase involved in cell wall biosynthesis